jgi:hypothetical protein
MSGILHIGKGLSPHWWLSPDIWVTRVGDPTTFPGVGNPIAGETYNVSVNVHDRYKDPVSKGWNLFVCWAIPTTGSIAIPPAAQILNNVPIPVTVPALSLVQLETASKWTPVFVNGGHECLIAMAYNEGAIGFPVSSLDGNATIMHSRLATVRTRRASSSSRRSRRRFPTSRLSFLVCRAASPYFRSRARSRASASLRPPSLVAAERRFCRSGSRRVVVSRSRSAGSCKRAMRWST